MTWVLGIALIAASIAGIWGALHDQHLTAGEASLLVALVGAVGAAVTGRRKPPPDDEEYH